MACSLRWDLNNPTYLNDCMEVIDLELRTKIVNSLGTNFHLWPFFFQTNLASPHIPHCTCVSKNFPEFIFFLRVGKGELQEICENIAFVCKGIFK